MLSRVRFRCSMAPRGAEGRLVSERSPASLTPIVAWRKRFLFHRTLDLDEECSTHSAAFPIIQVRTSLQVLALQRESNKVLVKRQRTAFPPNFVHSLDDSHMMMTAVACNNAGLKFAGVHDSYWTHACDVDEMSRILRSTFVELYSMPILENLLESFQASFPALVFPPLPDRGDFDLQEWPAFHGKGGLSVDLFERHACGSLVRLAVQLFPNAT